MTNKNVIEVDLTEFSKELLNMEMMIKELQDSFSESILKKDKECKFFIEKTLLELRNEIHSCFILLQKKDIRSLNKKLLEFKLTYQAAKLKIKEEYQKAIIRSNLKQRGSYSTNSSILDKQDSTQDSARGVTDNEIYSNPKDARFRLDYNDVESALNYIEYVKDMIDNESFVDSFGNSVPTNIKVLVKFKLYSKSTNKVSKFIFGKIPYILTSEGKFNGVGRFIGNRRSKQSKLWETSYEDIEVLNEDNSPVLYINNPVDLLIKCKAILYNNKIDVPPAYLEHPVWDIKSYVEKLTINY